MSGLTGGGGNAGINPQGTVNGPGQGGHNIIGNAGNQNSLVKNSPIMQFNKQPSLPPTYGGTNPGGINQNNQNSNISTNQSILGQVNSANNPMQDNTYSHNNSSSQQQQQSTPQKSIAASPGPNLKTLNGGGANKLMSLSGGPKGNVQNSQISNLSQSNQSNIVSSLVAKNLPIKSQIDNNSASRNQHNSNLGYGAAAAMGGLNQTQKLQGGNMSQMQKAKIFLTSQQIGAKSSGQQQSLAPLNYGLPNFQNSKISHKAFGTVKTFSANTNVGLIRQYNEDRIAIILNVIHPVNKLPVVQNWPNIQIFGIYDGHGGSKCAEYLKDNLHNNIINLQEFPSDIPKAIAKGSKQCDENFLTMLYDEYKQKFAETKQKMASINRAGSCALMVMTVDEDLYCINVGDSRAIMSRNFGEEYKSLTNDHKPMDPGEYERINANGGRIYQSQTVFKGNNPTPMIQQVTIDQLVAAADQDTNNPFVGPYRVAPGRLSVSRTFGDIEAKYPDLGGMPGVVVCDPDILYLKNGGQEIDFIILGSDGIFDKLTTEEICQLVWNIIRDHQNDPNLSMHQICGKCADEILRLAAKQKTMDNISIVMIGFKRLQDYLDRCRSQTPPPIGKASHLVGGMTDSIYGASAAVAKLHEKADIQGGGSQLKNQTQKIESIYKQLGASNIGSSAAQTSNGTNESALRLDQIKQASRAAAAKEFESNRLSRNLPPYQNMSHQGPYINSNASIDSLASQNNRSTQESQGSWIKSKIGKLRARNQGLSQTNSNNNSSHSRERNNMGSLTNGNLSGPLNNSQGVGNTAGGGLVLPPMVNAQKYQTSTNDAQRADKQHHLPPAGDQASLERRFNSQSIGSQAIGGHRPSQHYVAPSLNQNSYFQTSNQQAGIPGVTGKSNPGSNSNLSDRKPSFDAMNGHGTNSRGNNGGVNPSYQVLMSMNRENAASNNSQTRNNGVTSHGTNATGNNILKNQNLF